MCLYRFQGGDGTGSRCRLSAFIGYPCVVRASHRLLQDAFFWQLFARNQRQQPFMQLARPSRKVVAC